MQLFFALGFETVIDFFQGARRKTRQGAPIFGVFPGRFQQMRSQPPDLLRRHAVLGEQDLYGPHGHVPVDLRPDAE